MSSLPPPLASRPQRNHRPRSTSANPEGVAAGSAPRGAGLLDLSLQRAPERGSDAMPGASGLPRLGGTERGAGSRLLPSSERGPRGRCPGGTPGGVGGGGASLVGRCPDLSSWVPDEGGRSSPAAGHLCGRGFLGGSRCCRAARRGEARAGCRCRPAKLRNEELLPGGGGARATPGRRGVRARIAPRRTTQNEFRGDWAPRGGAGTGAPAQTGLRRRRVCGCARGVGGLLGWGPGLEGGEGPSAKVGGFRRDPKGCRGRGPAPCPAATPGSERVAPLLGQRLLQEPGRPP